MGLSETVLAALIGAAATMVTAVTQLMLALRARMKESRPRRNATRSALWVLALLVASAVGGFAYSELRAERAREDTRELRRELTQQLQALAQSTAKLELLGGNRAAALGPLASGPIGDQTIESVVHVAACEAGTLCDESSATQVELCADVPAVANVTAIELYARSDASSETWAENGVTLDQDFGGGRFARSSFAYPTVSEVRAVCTSLLHWNTAHGHMARMVVRYTVNAAAPDTPQTTVAARP